GILQLDAQGRVVRANPTAKALLALPEAVEGAAFSTLVRHAELRRLLQDAVEGAPGEPAELGLGERRLLVVAQRLADRPGEDRPGVVVALVDTTELRRLESVRRDFVANASHELKTPLTSIRGYADTLVADDPPAELRRQFLTTIRDNAERLQRIVDDLLDLSRLETGAWAAEAGEVRLEDVVADVWRQYEDRARQGDVALAVESSARRTLQADPLALRQVLSNLFDNALRYTPAGGRITVRARAFSPPAPEPASAGRPRPGDARRPAQALLAVEVIDTGSGIPHDALPRIFERFYRVDPARSRAAGGTGLGLAIVKHLVEAMGGRVEAESELGRGTTIRILLPRYDTVTEP
ncbi:MAG TPA: ATP-binding protein, partial [Longimicrobiales bacterium]|nr:ATP-binding protein [Longimicrobiales bacterium]